MIIKNSHKSTTRKKLLIIIGVFIVVMAAIPITYVYAFNGNIFGWQKITTQNTDKEKERESVNYEPTTPEQQESGTTVKSGSSDTPPAPTPIPGSDKKNVQITITAANQNESTLQIRTLIGAVEGSGVCTLTLTSTGKPTVTKTANSQALASTSTCQGFDIPISELPVGTWQAVIEYNSTSLTGSANQEIAVK